MKIVVNAKTERLVLYAERYALACGKIEASCVAKYIKHLFPGLSIETLHSLRDAIDQRESMEVLLSTKLDKRVWYPFREAIEKELERRKK